MGRRRQGRELALQALYLSDVSTIPADEAFDIVRIGVPADEDTFTFARSLAVGTALRQKDLDARIQEVAANWAIERMACVDRCLLRLASYELLHTLDTPVNVVIDEALEIGKNFSGEDSGRFLNGILDKIKNARPEAPEAAPTPASAPEAPAKKPRRAKAKEND
ncbi:MAG: transcription antitermination factor NusB [Elusimicrobiota bacterium]|jgi:N utilization substance protein B